MLQPEDFKDYPGQRIANWRARTVVACLTLIAGSTFVFGVARVSAAGGSVWLQTMDSCREAVGGASYQITDSSGGFTQNVATPAASPAAVGGGACPLERGNCQSMSTGCVQFKGLPASDTFKIRETVRPPANSSNPQGYAPCEGGSACQWELSTVSTDAGGNVSAFTQNVEPDGTVQRFPSTGSVSGSASDPIVFHDYGLGTGSCDGDGDADDHLTGSPGSHCQYPEDSESSACQPYPWSCSGSAGSAPKKGPGSKPGSKQGSGSSSKPSPHSHASPSSRHVKHRRRHH